MKNVCQFLVLADKHSAKLLKAKALKFIVDKKHDVNNLPEVEAIAKTNPNLMLEMFRAVVADQK